MRRRLPYRILAPRIDASGRIGGATVPRQKLGALHALRQDALEARRKLSRGNVGEIAAPERIVDLDAVTDDASVKPCNVSDHAIAHERRGSHGAVVGAGDGMSHARIDSVEAIALGNRDVPFDRRRLAAESQQTVALSARARHLIHDAARRADDVILHPLAGRGDFLWRERELIAARQPQPSSRPRARRMS